MQLKCSVRVSTIQEQIDMYPSSWLIGCALIFVAILPVRVDSQDPTLIGYWPLNVDSNDLGGGNLKSQGKQIRFENVGPNAKVGGAAIFDGKSSVIEVADAPSLRLGTDPFSVSMWVNTEETLDDVLGDLISKFDPDSRTGFQLGIYNHGGVTNGQPNSRQLHFGIDQGRIEEQFLDHGTVGNAVFIFSMCVHQGRLYAATCHAGKNETGRVFRFEGGERWTDMGSPDKANSISAMTVFDGALYVASSKYRLAGSSLAESENPNFGGRVFRLDDSDKWIDCGTVSTETEAIASLIVFKGQLYASSLYKPAGFFRYDGGQSWTSCATPNGIRVEALTVFNGSVFATSYDEGSVFRFDGQTWELAGKIPEATQTYGFGIHRGSLYVSEWPKAHVFRYVGGTNWVDTGKLGQELEAMPLLVYNGKMYGGTLPSAEVHRYDGDEKWTRLAQVDHTPDVKYRRAWSMAVYQGRLFVGTLPSGRVVSIEAGKNATLDRELPAGWHHIVAVKGVDRLRLYVDGKEVAQSTPFASSEFNLTNSKSLEIGFGAQDHFRGKISELRLYRGVLTPRQIANP